MMGPKKQDFWQRINILEGFFLNPLMNDGSSKIGHDFRNELNLKLNLSKNVFNKSWCPKLIFFNEIFFGKIQTIFDIKNQLSKYNFGTFR
jgi:hypothetical protein